MSDLVRRVTKTLTGEAGAVYSPCERYRYKLWRIWDSELPTLNFLMLNPSTATELVDDPTITRCTRRAEQLGYGTLIVTNLFALRSTDPKGLKQCDDAGGDCIEHEKAVNNTAIVSAALESTAVVWAWGVHGGYRDRDCDVRSLFMQHCDMRVVRVLGWTKGGSPLHPLMVSYDQQFSYVEQAL